MQNNLALTKKLHVLFVDDERLIREMVSDMLSESVGCVSLASNGHLLNTNDAVSKQARPSAIPFGNKQRDFDMSCASADISKSIKFHEYPC